VANGAVINPAGGETATADLRRPTAGRWTASDAAACEAGCFRLFAEVMRALDKTRHALDATAHLSTTVEQRVLSSPRRREQVDGSDALKHPAVQ
jgi:hypothetical protein